MTKNRTIPASACRFVADASVQAEDDNKPARFSGIAYGGGILKHPFWGEVAFDLGSIHSPQKLPMLIGHDRNMNAGFTTAISTDGQITVEGILLSNTHGQRVRDEAKQGFPWQMSVHIQPDDIEEVEAGHQINGHTFSRSGVIFRNSALREISFTPTGVDASTSASVFSHSSGEEHHHQHEEQSMTEEEIAVLKAENEALKAQFAAARAQAIDALLAECGINEQSDAHREAMKSMTAEQFNSCAALLRELRGKEQKPATPNVPDALFHEHPAPDAATAAGDDPLLDEMKAALAAEMEV